MWHRARSFFFTLPNRVGQRAMRASQSKKVSVGHRAIGRYYNGILLCYYIIQWKISPDYEFDATVAIEWDALRHARVCTRLHGLRHLRWYAPLCAGVPAMWHRKGPNALERGREGAQPANLSKKSNFGIQMVPHWGLRVELPGMEAIAKPKKPRNARLWPLFSPKVRTDNPPTRGVVGPTGGGLSADNPPTTPSDRGGVVGPTGGVVGPEKPRQGGIVEFCRAPLAWSYREP
jgi:hypothetical protein